MAKHGYKILDTLGGSMLEVRDGYARAELPLSDTVMQPTRVFRAGAIVTLAVEVAAALLVGEAVDPQDRKGKRFPDSVQLSVNLLTNDPVGLLSAEAKVLRKGRVAVVDTVISTSSGQTAALMSSPI
ncbi:MAG: PaaI family thioesterase [Candidatus Obscuribacterales bacterium]|nr:PaaI family thioesterase [Candidatus Obscuribacterales bacterium]